MYHPPKWEKVEVYPRPDGTIYICGIGGSDYITTAELRESAFLDECPPNSDRVEAATSAFQTMSNSYATMGVLSHSQACECVLLITPFFHSTGCNASHTRRIYETQGSSNACTHTFFYRYETLPAGRIAVHGKDKRMVRRVHKRRTQLLGDRLGASLRQGDGGARSGGCLPVRESHALRSGEVRVQRERRPRS